MQHYLVRLLRALLAIGCCWLLLSQAAAAQPRTLLVLGDSISAAYGMSLEEGWVALLEQRLADCHLEVQVVNASISGDTTGGGLRRLPALLAEHQPAVVLLELGGNDGLRGFPPQRIRDNLEAMAELARDSGAEVLLLSMEIPPNYGSRYTQAFRNSFRDAAEATGARLVPFLLDGVATDPTLMQADGIHPTAAAQPHLLENVLPSLKEIL